MPDAGEVTLPRPARWSARRPDQITALGICRTFQNIRLFANMTAIENVLVGMHARVRLGLWDVLARGPRFRRSEARAVASAARSCSSASGSRDQANEVARNLPYGDQRRLELARALASEPALLLLDEPTAGMTQGEAARPSWASCAASWPTSSLAILLIEHNMRVVMEVSDRVTVLDHGEKIAEGPPREVQARRARDRGLSRPRRARPRRARERRVLERP